MRKWTYGPLVKRLRQRPLTPLTSVRFRYGSPFYSSKTAVCRFIQMPLQLSRLEHLTVNQGVACSSQARGARRKGNVPQNIAFFVCPILHPFSVQPCSRVSPLFLGFSVPKTQHPCEKSIKHNDFLKFDYLKKMSHCGILLISFGNLYLFFQSPAHRSKGRCSLLLIAADRCFVMVLRRTGQSTGLCAVVSGSGSFHVVRSAAGRFFKTPAAV